MNDCLGHEIQDGDVVSNVTTHQLYVVNVLPNGQVYIVSAGSRFEIRDGGSYKLKSESENE